MTKEYKPNKMEQQILNDVNSMATSLKEISQAVNVLANTQLVNLRSDYVVEQIQKNKPTILKLFNILK